MKKTVPTLVAQVHDDTMTRPEDVQDIYDAIPVAEKSLYWIEGTDRRFDGYNFFGVHPEIPIEWFDKHIQLTEPGIAGLRPAPLSPIRGGEPTKQLRRRDARTVRWLSRRPR
jgi:hypothetical protein